jgi:hypothetical protein
MEFWITAERSQMSPQLINKKLRNTLNDRSDVELCLVSTNTGLRGIDPTVLVATVAATGTAIGALIGGMFKVLGQKSANRIVLRGKKGWQLEVPANISSKQFEETIKILKELDQEKLNLTIE